MKKILHIVQLLVLTSTLVLGKSGGDNPPKDVPKKPVSFTMNQNGWQPTSAVSPQLQSSLDVALNHHLQLREPANVQIVDKMDNIPFFVSEQADDDKSTARKMMSFLDANADRVKEDIDFEDLTTLPIGLKKKLGDKSVVTIGILKADFKQTHAEVTVFIRLTTQVNSDNSTIKERDLFFGVENLKFTKQGGFGAADFKAVLLGDYLLPMKKWTVKLKGGLDKSIAPSENDSQRCYVKFECGGFKELNVAADVVVPRSVLLPCDDAGEVIEDQSIRVTVSNLRVTTTNGIRDVVFELGNITPFCLPNHQEYAFKVANLAFDMSDVRNPDSVTFPVGYVGDIDTKWQGLYIGTFSVILPNEFEDKSSGKRVEIGATKVLVDRTGFSGRVFAFNIDKKVNAKKWTLSLDNIDIGFLQNKFQSGVFNGTLETPVNKENEEKAKLLTYTASIFLDGGLESGKLRSNYNIVVQTQKDLNLNMWFAKAKIYEGSVIDLSLVREAPSNKYKFKPRAVLSGLLQIGATKDGDNVGDYQQDKMIDIRGIEFTKLIIQTEVPYVTVENFKYNAGADNVFANFPIQLTKFQKYTGNIDGSPAPTNELWTEVGLKVDLFKGKFTGAGGFIIRSRYEDATGKLKPVGISVRDVYVRGDITPVTVEGYIKVVENNCVKTIQGGLEVVVTKPKEFSVGIHVLFGKTMGVGGYKFGFVDGYAMFPDAGINVGVFDIYGVGLGVYWNMKPQIFSTSGAIDPSNPNQACTDNLSYKIGNDPILSYKPDQSIPLGIRIMAAIKNPDAGTGKTAFKARVYLDFALSREFGINHIAIYGNGVIAGDFVGGDTKEQQKDNAQKVTASVTETNIKAGEANQAKSNEKAKKLNEAVNGVGNTAPPAGIGVINFTAGIMFDIPNKTFHAEAEVFMKQGDLVGIGPNNRVGNAVIHYEPGKWYIHAGQAAKNQRIGLRYGTTAQIDAYLMLGHGVPQFPRPDQEVIDFFPSLATKFSGPVCSNLTNGKAFALGASAKLQLGAEKGGFYAKGTAIAGLDILISNSAPCITAGSWLGQGQVYALFKAEAGYKRFTLANLGLGIYGYVQAPKPFGMEADVCIAVPRWVDRDRVKCLTASMGDNCTSKQVTTCANTN